MCAYRYQTDAHMHTFFIDCVFCFVYLLAAVKQFCFFLIKAQLHGYKQ